MLYVTQLNIRARYCSIVFTNILYYKYNIVEMIQNIFTNGLNLHINIVHAKRRNGLNENGYYKSGYIMAEMRYVEYRIHVLKFKHRLKQYTHFLHECYLYQPSTECTGIKCVTVHEW